MREKKIDLSKLVEAKYKLDDVEQAFEAAIVPWSISRKCSI